MNKNYTIGLDIGTNSVGWAVIDDKFNLVQGKKRIDDNGVKKRSRTNLWGVRLFDDGDTAEGRRSKRGLRRRYKRRHERLNYLRGIFEEEIFKVDDSFFIRMDESFYQLDDKNKLEYKYRDKNGMLQTKKLDNKEVFKYPLFKTEKDEKDFYKKFPTIYHLRDYLMKTDEKADIRLIYLAMHHIIKYRGHFINEGQEFNLKNINIIDSLIKTLEEFNSASTFVVEFGNVDLKLANTILKDNKKSKSKKAYDLNQLYKIDADSVYLAGNEEFVLEYENMTDKQKDKFIEEKQKRIKDLFTALVGNKIALDKIFGKKEYSYKENDDIPKDLYYKNESFEDDLLSLENILTPEELNVIIEGKKVYESIVLSGILTKDTLSGSMVEKYELHKTQLKELKAFIKNVSEDMFEEFFKKDGIYTNFVEGKGNPAKVTSRDDFYKEIKKSFEEFIPNLKFPDVDKEFEWKDVSVSEDEKLFIEKITKEMQFETYLPKQRMSDNAAIPYQVHEHELVGIIKNQGQYYSFLEEKEADLFILQTLMKFRIPYYVGPLTEAKDGVEGKKNSSKSTFAWMQKYKEEKVTPWNFNEVVDKDSSAVEFIERMTSYCTYLPEEKVLPKNSLLYQEFCVYNELIVSGYIIKREKNYFGKKTIDQLVDTLFKKKKKVYEQDVLDFLRNEKNIIATEIFGIDRKTTTGKPCFNNSMSTYIDLVKMGISPEEIDNNRDVFDEVVKWQTIFTDKKSLKSKIERANKSWNIFTEEQVAKLSSKHYTGFGNLSKKLLDGIRDKESGKTIIETLKDGGYDNFMRLVSGSTANRYTFKDQIEAMQTAEVGENLSYDVVEKLAGSPAIKKGIWQSIKIIKELEKFVGRDNIGKIVIEMSRGSEGGRTMSRYAQLKKEYDSFEGKNQEVYDELKKYDKNQKALDNEKLHLYFRQNGIDAYSKEELKILELSSYEVDHIIPQCFIKDDSLDNKVLVTKTSNQNKGGNVPNGVVIAKMKNIWESWAKAGLISQRKYKSLTIGVLKDKVKEGFINRQLVENRQITKHVANILSKHFEGTETVVLTPKSALTTQFRKGIIYLPNPDYDKEKKNKRFIEEKLHSGFPKNRDINDYHHAHDAYLNAIVALYLYREYPELKNAWVYGNYARNSEEMFGKWVSERKDKSLQLISNMRDEIWVQTDPDSGEIVELSRDKTLKKIEKTLGLRNVNIVKKVEKQKGKFGDESVYKKDNKLVTGIKTSLSPSEYGGTKSPVSAFVVIVECNNGKYKSLSIPTMYSQNYDKAIDKVKFIKELYPKEKIQKIIISDVKKYTRFDNESEGKTIRRMIASAQEAQKADCLSLTVSEMRLLNLGDDETLRNIFDKITMYLEKNVVYNEENINKWKNEVFAEFEQLSKEDKINLIKDAFSITKQGTTNAKGLIKGKIGSASGQQRHKVVSLDVINAGSKIVYQSVTGLYEKRIKL
ncbi:MAG: type II CRISPR RNA-guided endonuclease Cas9 [Anaerovoracaceae bacterium]